MSDLAAATWQERYRTAIRRSSEAKLARNSHEAHDQLRQAVTVIGEQLSRLEHEMRPQETLEVDEAMDDVRNWVNEVGRDLPSVVAQRDALLNELQERLALLTEQRDNFRASMRKLQAEKEALIDELRVVADRHDRDRPPA